MRLLQLVDGRVGGVLPLERQPAMPVTSSCLPCDDCAEPAQPSTATRSAIQPVAASFDPGTRPLRDQREHHPLDSPHRLGVHASPRRRDSRTSTSSAPAASASFCHH
jgi:hypothetical protein